VNVEDLIAIGEYAEHVCCELYVAATAGEGEDFETGAGWGFEVAGDDLGLPG
jgi:hypothetical protein